MHTHYYMKEMRTMPWYINSVTTCKVLHKIADQNKGKELQDLKSVLDNAAALIWQKQKHYNQIASSWDPEK